MGDGSGTNSYPPVGDPDRYDMIVQRGRTLRRRRRYSLGAGAGGTVVALAIAVVLITGGNNGNDVDATEMAADPTTTTTEAPTTTTTTPLPDVMTATIDPIATTVLVQDPTHPVSDEAKQCVHLSLAAADDPTMIVGEGTSCADDPALYVKATNGIVLDCGTQVERPEPYVGPTEPEVSTFTYQIDESIPPGSYALTARASSGIGDECPDPTDAGSEGFGYDEDLTQIELLP